MIVQVYSIFDIKAVEYGPFFLAKNDDIAFRMIKDQFHDLIVPDDYDLYCLGTFDTESGLLAVSSQRVCNLSDFFPPVKEND